tara:strand:- start:140 stop:1165 length:1026 start_codon:yes stop_codon:yes gene_type:complete
MATIKARVDRDNSTIVKARVGSQNAVRVLSNASAPPTKLLNLTDINSTDKTDGNLLIWDFLSETFVLGNDIDRNILISDSTSSTTATTGALVITGGVGIGENLNVAGLGNFGTGSNSININGSTGVINVGSGVTISATEGIFVPALTVGNATNSASLTADTLTILGITTLSSVSGFTTIGGNLFVKDNLEVAGTSNFIGTATFRGGTINLGDGNTDDINVSGEFVSHLIPNDDNLYDIGSLTRRWRNASFSGLTTTNTLNVSGESIFQSNISITGFVTVTEGLYYDSDDYDGPNGIAYFDNTGKLIGAASTENALTETYYILTTNAVGIPTWTSVIDGGVF